MWLEQLVTRLAKKGEPAVEQAWGQATEAHVDSEWGALVATAGQHHRRPEIPQGGQMAVPTIVTDGARENRAELRVSANLGVEGFDQSGNVVFRDQALLVVSRNGVGRYGAQSAPRRGWSKSSCRHGTLCQFEHLFWVKVMALFGQKQYSVSIFSDPRRRR